MNVPASVAGDNTVIGIRQNPWLGLASFEERHSSFFFGRTSEIAEMENMVLRGPACLLFGRSGLGKTSLLRAGLFPRLRSKDFLPVYVRLNFADEAPPLAEQVKQELWNALQDSQIKARCPAPEETLWEYTHREDVDFWDNRVRLITPVLVFDQFEEIFTLGRRSPKAEAGVANLLAEMQAIVNNSPPESVRQRFEARPELVAEFDFDKRTVKVLVGLREDYLAHFESLRRQCLVPGTNRMRLEPLNGLQAMEVVLKPGKDLVDEAVAHRIIEVVSHQRVAGPGRQPAMAPNGDADGPLNLEHMEKWLVEPALLSVVCRELNELRRRAGLPKITANLLTSDITEEILVNFYEQAIGDMPETVRVFVEDNLLTTTGYRDRAAQDDALQKPGVTEDCLNTLVSRRLLRREESNGVIWLELTHDLVTGVIQQSRVRRQQRQAEEAQREAEEGQQKAEEARRRAEEARRKAEETAANYKLAVARMKKVTLFAGTCLICAVLGWVFARIEALSARNAEISASMAAGSASMAADSARREASRADEQERFSKQQVLDSSKEDLDTARQFFDVDQWGKGIAYLGHSLSLNRGSSDAAVYLWSAIVYGRHGDGRLPEVWNTNFSPAMDAASGSRATFAALSPAGSCVLVATTKGTSLHGTTDGAWMCQLANVTPRKACFSPDGKSLLIINSTNSVNSAGETANSVQVWATNGDLICTLRGVPDYPICAAFSPNSRRVVVTGLDSQGRTAGVWELPNSNCICVLTNDIDKQWVPSASFSQDGQWIVTAHGPDRTACVWNAANGHCMARLGGSKGHADWVMAAVFSPDGNLVASSSNDKTARIWDWRQPRKPPVILQHNGSVLMAGFSPDGSRVVTASADGTARIWSTNGDKLTDPLQHRSRVNMAAFGSINGSANMIITRCADSTVHVWNTNGLPLGEPLQHGRLIRLFDAVLTDGLQIATACSEGYGLWNINATHPGQLLDHEGKKVWSARFSPDGTKVITACADGIARIWDLTTQPPRLLFSLTNSSSDLRYAEFSSNGKLVLTAGGAGEANHARIWNVTDGELVGQFAGHAKNVLMAKFDPSGTRVVTASLDGSARIYSLEQPLEGSNLYTSFHPLRHPKGVILASFSPDGTNMFTSSLDNSVRIWCLTNGTDFGCRLEIPHQAIVRNAAFSTDGRYLATASSDGTVGIAKKTNDVNNTWINQTNLPFPGGGMVCTVKFSPDDSFLAAGADDGTIAVWQVHDGMPVPKQPVRMNHHEDSVNSLEFINMSSGGLFMVTASADKTARLWKISTNGVLPYSEPFTHQGSVLQASFSPDGRRVVTVSDDGKAGVWRVPPEITWGDAMTNQITQIPGNNQFSTLGDALTAAISGFYFQTNSGQIFQLGINPRRDLNQAITNVIANPNCLLNTNWVNLYRWWLANSQPASGTNRPWPQIN